MAKHIYDITVLMSSEKIAAFLADRNKVTDIVELKRREELNRKGGVDSSLAVKDFAYFGELKDNKYFTEEFERMQRVYVFNEKDKIPLPEAMTAIDNLRQLLDWI